VQIVQVTETTTYSDPVPYTAPATVTVVDEPVAESVEPPPGRDRRARRRRPRRRERRPRRSALTARIQGLEPALPATAVVVCSALQGDRRLDHRSAGRRRPPRDQQVRE
jgi:hypothetical protein